MAAARARSAARVAARPFSVAIMPAAESLSGTLTVSAEAWPGAEPSLMYTPCTAASAATAGSVVWCGGRCALGGRGLLMHHDKPPLVLSCACQAWGAARAQPTSSMQAAATHQLVPCRMHRIRLLYVDCLPSAQHKQVGERGGQAHAAALQGRWRRRQGREGRAWEAAAAQEGAAWLSHNRQAKAPSLPCKPALGASPPTWPLSTQFRQCALLVWPRATGKPSQRCSLSAGTQHIQEGIFRRKVVAGIASGGSKNAHSRLLPGRSWQRPAAAAAPLAPSGGRAGSAWCQTCRFATVVGCWVLGAGLQQLQQRLAPATPCMIGGTPARSGTLQGACLARIFSSRASLAAPASPLLAWQASGGSCAHSWRSTCGAPAPAAGTTSAASMLPSLWRFSRGCAGEALLGVEASSSPAGADPLLPLCSGGAAGARHCCFHCVAGALPPPSKSLARLATLLEPSRRALDGH